MSIINVSIDDGLAINDSRIAIENLSSVYQQDAIPKIICNCPPVFSPILIIIGPIIGLAVAIGVIIFNHRPTRNEVEISNYINAESNQRIHEYVFDLKLSWKKFPWEKILKLKLLKLRSILSGGYHEVSYKPPNDDEKKLEPSEYFIQKSGNFLDIRLKQRGFFFEKNITQLYLKTWDDEKSNYKSRIPITYYPNDSSPAKIIVKNENNVEIISYVHTLNEIITAKIITVHSDYRTHIMMNNVNVVSDCLLENQRLSIIISRLPKADQSNSSLVTVNL